MLVHTASFCSGLCKQSSFVAGNLDAEPFPASLRDFDRSPLAALDLMQHGLASDAEPFRGLIEPNEAVGNIRDEPAPGVFGESDPPGRLRGYLLAGEQAVLEPASDGRAGHAELAGCLLDRHQLAVGIGRWRGGDPGALAEVPHARLGKWQSLAGEAALLVQRAGDLAVGGCR